MRSVILLVVGAAWVAVLLPPLLRSRIENRPGSSIDSFQSRLSSLQRSVPSAGVRGMARPLAGGQRGAEMRYSGVRPGDVRYAPQRVGSLQPRPAQRTNGYAQHPLARSASMTAPQRFELRGTRQADHGTRQLERRPQATHVADYGYNSTRQAERRAQTGLQRRDETRTQLRQRQAPAPTARTRASAKQRRQNVLFMLVLVTAVTGLLVAVTNSAASKAALAVAACSLVGYVYMLAQLRRNAAEFDDLYDYDPV